MYVIGRDLLLGQSDTSDLGQVIWQYTGVDPALPEIRRVQWLQMYSWHPISQQSCINLPGAAENRTAMPSKHETSAQRWLTAGPPFTTLAQQ